jgi:hypothetical protein
VFCRERDYAVNGAARQLFIAMRHQEQEQIRIKKILGAEGKLQGLVVF